MGNQQTTCCICLEKRVRGVPCTNKHLTCKDCFPQYVKSCYENGAKFCDQGFVIRCPDPGCMSNPLTVADLRANLSETIMDAYVESLIRYNNRMKAGVEIPKESVTQQIVDALNLKCPKCKTVLDQNPDGCCAMRCITCGAYFCWLCFKICFGTIDSHAHVGSCKLNGSKNLFAPATVVQAAHKRQRILQLHSVLKASHDPAQHGTLTWKETNQTRTLLNDALPSLKLNDLTVNAVLVTPEVEERPAPPAAGGAPYEQILQHMRQNNGAWIVAGLLLGCYLLSKLFSSTPSVVQHVNTSFHSLVPYTSVNSQRGPDEDIAGSIVTTKVLSISLCPKHAKDTDDRYIAFTKFTSSTSGSSEATSGVSESVKKAAMVYDIVSPSKNSKVIPDNKRDSNGGLAVIKPYLCVGKDGLHVYYNDTLSGATGVAAPSCSGSKPEEKLSLFQRLIRALIILSAFAVVAGYYLPNNIMERQDRRTLFMAGVVVGGVCIGLQVALQVMWLLWEYAGTLFLIIAIGGGIYANMIHARQ